MKKGIVYIVSILCFSVWSQTKVKKVSFNDFADFAKSQGTNYKMLKIFNPWLRGHKLTNTSKKTYYITIPEKGARAKEYFPKEKKVVKKKEPVVKKDSNKVKVINDSSDQ